MSDQFSSICKISASGARVYTHTVIIEDIKQTIKDFPNQKKLVCDEFKIPLKYSSLLGQVAVYPSGARKDEKGYLAVFFYLKPKTSDMDEVPVKVEYSIIDTNGEKTEVKEFENKVSV